MRVEQVLNIILYKSADGQITVTVGTLVAVVAVLVITYTVLKFVKNIFYKRLHKRDIPKFNVVFAFIKYIVFSLVILLTLDSVGVKVTAILLGSTAIFVGLGLGLQQLFQDIISGIFILTDKTVVVGDIIEINGKIGRIKEINLRTTRAETPDDKILIIPNHIFLAESLLNWTQNGTETRESISVRVSFNIDIEKVKELLILAAKTHKEVIKSPEPDVSLEDFTDIGLELKVSFTIKEGFNVGGIKSDIRFEIEKLFRANAIAFATLPKTVSNN